MEKEQGSDQTQVILILEVFPLILILFFLVQQNSNSFKPAQHNPTEDHFNDIPALDTDSSK